MQWTYIINIDISRVAVYFTVIVVICSSYIANYLSNTLHAIVKLLVHLIVARIRFQSSHYTVSEGSPSICVPVENMSPSSSNFAVSYSFGTLIYLNTVAEIVST